MGGYMDLQSKSHLHPFHCDHAHSISILLGSFPTLAQIHTHRHMHTSPLSQIILSDGSESKTILPQSYFVKHDRIYRRINLYYCSFLSVCVH